MANEQVIRNGLIVLSGTIRGELYSNVVVSGSIASGQISAYHLGTGTLSSGGFYKYTGNGVTVWENNTVSIENDISTNGTRYIGFLDSSSGSTAKVYTSNTKLTFNPSTGDVVVGGTLTENSDVRIKKDITTIENAIEKVNNLRGVYFTRIGSEIKNIGVIAQEVESVMPEVVRESDGLKSVAYGNIVGLLIEAIKEQNIKIKDLENRLNNL